MTAEWFVILSSAKDLNLTLKAWNQILHWRSE